MDKNFQEKLPELVNRITTNYKGGEHFFAKEDQPFPDRDNIIEIIRDIRKLIFPGYFGSENLNRENPDYYVGDALIKLHNSVKKEIYAALTYENNNGDYSERARLKAKADEYTLEFIEKLTEVQKTIMQDVQAAYDGDPAANNLEEIIFSYPGLLAIFVYRIAHILYVQHIPFIPRIMTEYAHSRTGIDINAGATIGENFFMDHGTGIVIGETTTIGNNVKIYQGVTLGALSTKQGHLLNGVKRHPTIEDDVTIYSNASVLGGDTVIGKGSIIGGSAFVVASVPPYTKVYAKNPELTYKNDNPQDESSDGGSWVI